MKRLLPLLLAAGCVPKDVTDPFDALLPEAADDALPAPELLARAVSSSDPMIRGIGLAGLLRDDDPPPLARVAWDPDAVAQHTAISTLMGPCGQAPAVEALTWLVTQEALDPTTAAEVALTLDAAGADGDWSAALASRHEALSQELRLPLTYALTALEQLPGAQLAEEARWLALPYDVGLWSRLLAHAPDQAPAWSDAAREQGEEDQLWSVLLRQAEGTTPALPKEVRRDRGSLWMGLETWTASSHPEATLWSERWARTLGSDGRAIVDLWSKPSRRSLVKVLAAVPPEGASLVLGHLYRLPPDLAEEALAWGLGAEDPSVLASAARSAALCDIAPPIDRLTPLLGHDRALVRTWAALALTRPGLQAPPAEEAP